MGMRVFGIGVALIRASRGNELHKKVQKMSQEKMANHHTFPHKMTLPTNFTVPSPARLFK
jgi:hypothetical protein